MHQSPKRIDELVKIFIHATRVGSGWFNGTWAYADFLTDGDRLLGHGRREIGVYRDFHASRHYHVLFLKIFQEGVWLTPWKTRSYTALWRGYGSLFQSTVFQ
jgi:hypothetical protein